MSRYIPPEEMNEAQIREQLDAEYKHWDDLKKNGCSDPAWPDGVNLNLVRNHIIYWYRLLRERTSQTVQLSMFDAGMDLRNERRYRRSCRTSTWFRLGSTATGSTRRGRA